MSRLNQVLSVKALVVGIVALVLAALFTFKYAEAVGFPDRLRTLVQAEE